MGPIPGRSEVTVICVTATHEEADVVVELIFIDAWCDKSAIIFIIFYADYHYLYIYNWSMVIAVR